MDMFLTLCGPNPKKVADPCLAYHSNARVRWLKSGDAAGHSFGIMNSGTFC